jgi:hypothetical protein
MSQIPPSREPPDPVDDRYRRASALDPSRPGEAVRRAILTHAAQLASQRSGTVAGSAVKFRRSAASRAWRVGIFGTLAAAAIAGIVVAPRFLTPGGAPSAASTRSVERLVPNSPRVASAPPTRAVESPPAAAAVRREGTRVPEASASVGRSSDGARAQLQEEPARPKPDAAPLSAQSVARQAPPQQLVAARAAAPAPQADRTGNAAAALRHAAELGDLAALQGLLGKQTDVDARDPSGRTALMLATLRGHTEAVVALLAHGADPNAADAQGITPLAAAAAGDQPAIVAALQRYGAR